jgi:hypothetical protein
MTRQGGVSNRKDYYMSETITASAIGDATLPVEFRVEMFYMEHPEALTKWKRKAWSDLFDDMALAQRIELCDAILQKEEVITDKLAAYLANAVVRCGNSNHIRWDKTYKTLTYYLCETRRRRFWYGIYYHTQIFNKFSDDHHREAYRIVGALLYNIDKAA